MLVFTLSKASRTNTNAKILVILLILIHGLLPTLYAERTMRRKILYFTSSALHVQRNITEPVREYFALFWYQPSHFLHTFSINAYR